MGLKLKNLICDAISFHNSEKGFFFMQKSYFKKVSFFLSAAILFFCFAASAQAIKNVFPIPYGELTVKDNVIFHNGAPFAELRYFICDRKMSDAEKASPKRVHGLSIYYYPYEKEIWIFPAWSVEAGGREYHSAKDVQQIWDEYRKKPIGPSPLRLKGSLPNSKQIKESLTVEVSISKNGRTVTYNGAGRIFRYDVETGMSF